MCIVMKTTDYGEVVNQSPLQECQICLEKNVEFGQPCCGYAVCKTCLKKNCHIQRTNGLPSSCPYCRHLNPFYTNKNPVSVSYGVQQSPDLDKPKDVDETDATFRQWASRCTNGARNAVSCPVCGVWIQKTGGCDNMMCPFCYHEFCYSCGKPWNNRMRLLGTHADTWSINGCQAKFPYYQDSPKLILLARVSIVVVPGFLVVCLIHGAARFVNHIPKNYPMDVLQGMVTILRGCQLLLSQNIWSYMSCVYSAYQKM